MAGAARAASLPQYGRPIVAEPCHSNVSSSQTAETSGLAARWEYVFRGSLDPRTRFLAHHDADSGKRREAVCFPPVRVFTNCVYGKIVPRETGFCPFANKPDVFHTVSTLDPGCRKLPGRGLIRADCSGAKDDRFLYPDASEMLYHSIAAEISVQFGNCVWVFCLLLLYISNSTWR